jgi:hypothetical protein
VAVIQISKIQVRRGQKNSNTGVPQLSSAEFAWAVDTQELFIGNGSVAEGAPYVGNTKIITEHDNILDLANSYQFAYNDTAITASVPRSLQSKTDEYVSVADFGAVGDGSTDCVFAFQTAFEQLFRNPNTNYRKVLTIPNGEYLMASDLAIPSNVIMRGETQLGAILNIGDNNIRFITSEGLEFVDFDSTNRPVNVEISNLTINRRAGQLVLSGVADSRLDRVKFLGEYTLGDEYVSKPTISISIIANELITSSGTHGLEINDILIPRITANGLATNEKYYVKSIPSAASFTLSRDPDDPAISFTSGGSTELPLSIVCDVISDVITPLSSQPAAVFWLNRAEGVKSTNLVFRDCHFEANSVSVKCLQNVTLFDTSVRFESCRFFVNDTAIYIQGLSTQGNFWTVTECEFEEIAKQAFRSTNGYGTQISHCKFKNCGNGTNTATDPSDYIVYFGEKLANVVFGCTSDRQQAAGVTSSFNTVSIPEVYNADKASFVDRNTSVIGTSDSFTALAVFSTSCKYITINYTLELGDHIRAGILSISVGNILKDYDSDELTELQITDDFQYSSPLASSRGGSLMTNFEFNAVLRDNDDDSGVETIVLTYKNPQATGAAGTISFDVVYGV